MAELLDFQGKKAPQERSSRDQNAALQRLLDIKGPVRRQQKNTQPFLDALDDVLETMDQAETGQAGWMDGSMSGQCWCDFMESLRFDLLSHLQRYRDGARGDAFSPASLIHMKAERQRIERLYVRDLVALYQLGGQKL